jgi:glyoxylase-like metal-dependent hydrolase (beta-lactamase superfamily II)
MDLPKLPIDTAAVRRIPERLRASGAPHDVTDDVAYLRVAIVNVYFVGAPDAGDRGWVLVDAGLRGSAAMIARAAAMRYGADARPSAIVLTHGHFDHVGALGALAEAWDVPIYAHDLEMPFLTGVSAYPPPDPTVGGGAMARMAYLYPRGPYDFTGRIRSLPTDGHVPGMPGWRWIHTPGHAPGHVSLFRDTDRLLIAGDAVVTTRQESAIAVATQREEIGGPPMYYTPDWESARRSVETIAELAPEILATGHGRPLSGPAVLDALVLLAENFVDLAVPRHGRYVDEPARFAANGVVYIPPAPRDTFPFLVGGAALAVVGGIVLAQLLRGRDDGRVADASYYDEGFADGLALEASLMAGDDTLGSSHEDEQHVPVARWDDRSASEMPAMGADARWSQRYGARQNSVNRPFEGFSSGGQSMGQDGLREGLDPSVADRAEPSGA